MIQEEFCIARNRQKLLNFFFLALNDDRSALDRPRELKQVPPGNKDFEYVFEIIFSVTVNKSNAKHLISSCMMKYMFARRPCR
jgi:hypothetical protein